MSHWISARTQARRFYERAKRALSPEVKQRFRAFANLRSRFYQDFWSSAAHNIGASIEDMGYGYSRISRGGGMTFVRLSDVALDSHLILDIAGNKALSNRLLMEKGYPVPGHLEFDLTQMDKALDFLNESQGPVVVKPASGTGGGRGVTTRISTAKQLRQASYLAAAFDRKMLVERQVQGGSYRLLYLNGEYIDAIRRDPPVVTGDGRSTIRALIKAENRSRLEGPGFSALSPLVADMECRLTLAELMQGLDSVPDAGESVVVKGVVNENAAPRNHIVRDQVHTSIIEAGKDMAGLFGLQLAGLDLITTDIRVPLEQSGGVINEVNTTPGLHHHVLVAEQEQKLRLGEQLLEFILGR